MSIPRSATYHSRLSIGLVGAGAMGTNHARVIAASPMADLIAVVDTDGDRATRLAASTRAAASTVLDAVFGCDAVIVACTTEHHVAVALELIERGIPVLIEKPLATELAQVETIISAAAHHGVALMCGFVERFNAAVTTTVGLLTEPPVHAVSLRHSPRTPRIATSVVYDLLIHDIDLVVGLFQGSNVEAVAGAAPPGPAAGVAEVADCTLQFTGGSVATLSASRSSQRKIRSLMVTTPSTLIDVDLLRQDVTVYRNLSQSLVGETPGYRAETVIDIPFVRHRGEPLALQFEHFTRLVRGDVDPAAERAALLAPHQVAATLVDVAGGPVAAGPSSHRQGATNAERTVLEAAR